MAIHEIIIACVASSLVLMGVGGFLYAAGQARGYHQGAQAAKMAWNIREGVDPLPDPTSPTKTQPWETIQTVTE